MKDANANTRPAGSCGPGYELAKRGGGYAALALASVAWTLATRSSALNGFST
jgi:hypothetical protein